MNWDEQGRLWVAITRDYPNEIQPAGQGRGPRDLARAAGFAPLDYFVDAEKLFSVHLLEARA